jgi:hypothetical protein
MLFTEIYINIITAFIRIEIERTSLCESYFIKRSIIFNKIKIPSFLFTLLYSKYASYVIPERLWYFSERKLKKNVLCP